MNIERRLANLEAKLRHSRLMLVGLGVCLVLVCTVAADTPFVDLLCQSVTVKDAGGKTVTKMTQTGDVDIGGTLKVKETDVLAALQQNQQTIVQLQKDVNGLKASLASFSGQTLKVTNFGAVFTSENSAGQGGYLFKADVCTSHTHPTKFGKQVVAAWWVPSRGLYDFGKWGYVGATPAGNQVNIGGSAMKDAGRIEATIFVVYQE